MIRACASILVLLLVACAAPLEDQPEPAPRTHPAANRSDARDGRPGSAAADAKLTLAECLDLARRNSRSVGIAERRVLLADDRVDEAIASVLPHLSASARYDARSNRPRVEQNGQKFGFTQSRTGTGTVSLIVPIYSFGRAGHERDALELGVEAARFDAQTASLRLSLDVKRAYYRLLEAERIEDVVRSSLAPLQAQLRIARDFHDQGLVAANDVLAVEVETSRRRQESIRALGNVALARAALNRLLGRDIEWPTRVVDVLDVAPWQGSFLTVLSRALDQRPDLEALRTRVHQAQSKYKATRAALLPAIYAFGALNYTTDTVQVHQEWASGGAAINIPLFDGGETLTRITQHERLIEEAADLRDERSDDIVLEVKAAHLSLLEVAQRIPVARETVVLAGENLRITRDQYAQGLVSSADVLLDEERLTRARSDSYRTLYAYHEALAGLEFAVGGSLDEEAPQ